MTYSLIILPIVASLALASLVVLWLLTSRREVLRLQGGKIMRLAARLHADLRDDLDQMEAKNRALKAYVAKASAPGKGLMGPVVAPDLIEELNAKAIAELRNRAERTYGGLRTKQGRELERFCRDLEAISREVSLLAAEIDGREATLKSMLLPKRATARPPLEVLRAA